MAVTKGREVQLSGTTGTYKYSPPEVHNEARLAEELNPHFMEGFEQSHEEQGHAEMRTVERK